MDGAVNELGAIAGQKPVITKAKKSIAAFKLREGMAIGTMVTLRGDRMYEFLDRLMNVALPRVRDFRGVSPKSFDGRGNYTLGVKDQLIFPEIDYSKVDKTKGMNICITTTARTDAEGLALLKQMGMPFRPVSGRRAEEIFMATTAKIAKDIKLARRRRRKRRNCSAATATAAGAVAVRGRSCANTASAVCVSGSWR